MAWSSCWSPAPEKLSLPYPRQYFPPSGLRPAWAKLLFSKAPHVTAADLALAMGKKGVGLSTHLRNLGHALMGVSEEQCQEQDLTGNSHGIPEISAQHPHLCCESTMCLWHGADMRWNIMPGARARKRDMVTPPKGLKVSLTIAGHCQWCGCCLGEHRSKGLCALPPENCRWAKNHLIKKFQRMWQLKGTRAKPPQLNALSQLLKGCGWDVVEQVYVDYRRGATRGPLFPAV